MEHDFL